MAKFSGATAPIIQPGKSGYTLPNTGSVPPLGGDQEVEALDIESFQGVPEAEVAPPAAAPQGVAPPETLPPEGVPPETGPVGEGLVEEIGVAEGAIEEGPTEEGIAEETLAADPLRATQEAVDAGEWTGAEDEAALLEYEKSRQRDQTKYTTFLYDRQAQADGLFPRSKGMGQTETDMLVHTANKLNLALNTTGIVRDVSNAPEPSKFKGMTAIKTATKTTDERQATGYAMTAMIIQANMMRGVRDTSALAEVSGIDETSAEELDFDFFGQAEKAAEAAKENIINDGVPIDQFVKGLGSTLKKVSNARAYDENGNVIELPEAEGNDTINDFFEAGSALLRAGLDSQIFMVRPQTKLNIKTGLPENVLDENGEPVMVVSLNPVRGTEFKDASKKVFNMYKNQAKFLAQVTPVTPAGDFVGAKKGERRKNKGDVGVGAMQDAATKLGRVPVSIVPEAEFWRKKLLQEAIMKIAKLNPDGSLMLDKKGNPSVDIEKIFNFQNGEYRPEYKDPIFGLHKINIDRRDFEDPEGNMNPASQKQYVSLVEQAYNQKLKDLLYRDTAYTNNITRGVPVYNRHMLDSTVNRMYNESTDANLQAHKDARAIYGPPPKTMMITNNNYHKTGLSEGEINSFWKGLRDGNTRELTPHEKEMSFLLCSAHALAKLMPDMKYNTDVKIGPWILEEVFGGEMGAKRMNDWAKIGKMLKNAALEGDPSQTPRERVAGRPTIGGSFQLDPEVQEMFDTQIRPHLSDDNWGFIIRGLTSMSDYVDAKNQGKNTFVPRVTSAIDQNSAGRSFAALDIGDEKVLLRTGMLWSVADQVNADGDRSTQVSGDPRAYFVNKAIEGGIAKVFGEAGGSKDELNAAFTGLFKEFSTRDGFAKALAKTPLMTSDYGKPTMFHEDSARAFFNKMPEFKERMDDLISEYGLKEDSVYWLNKIYGTTLNSIIDYASTNAPKQAQRFANMLGSLLQIKGAWGEDVSLGGLMQQDTGQVIEFIDEQGGVIRIPKTKTVSDVAARAKKKNIRNKELFESDEYSVNDDTFLPRPGTYAINAIGPWLGQYRESIVTGGLVNILNPDVNAKPHQMKWIQTVHDNAILDAESFALGLFHGNNGSAMEKAIEYSPAVAVYDAVMALSKKSNTLISRHIVNGKIDIGLNGPFKLVLSELDYDRDNLKRKLKEKGELSKEDRAYLAFLENPKSGIVTTDLDPMNRYNSDDKTLRGTVEVTPDQFGRILQTFMAHHGIFNNLKKWATLGGEKKATSIREIKKLISEGLLAFFN